MKYLIVLFLVCVFLSSCNKKNGDTPEKTALSCSFSGTEFPPISITPPNASTYYIDVHPDDINIDGATTFFWGSDTETNAIDEWDGLANTTLITSVLGNWNGGIYPAKICEDLVAFGCDDWYLPSKREQAAMQADFVQSGFGNYSDTYWSSTEIINAISAWTTNFNNSNLTQNNHAKDLLNTDTGLPHDKCRCVRRSSCSTSLQIAMTVSPPDGDQYNLYVHPDDINIDGTTTFFWGSDTETNAIDEWDGLANTTLITSVLGNWNGGIYPAKICEDLVAFGCDDWYLPSKREQAAMQADFVQSGFGNYSDTYWSSTEIINAISAWTTNFNNSNLTQNNHAKDLLNTDTGLPHDKCRCVRRD